MATIIDALTVTLGLDAGAFAKGQKEASTSIAKTREAAVKHGAGIEKSMDKASESFERLARNTLKLFAIFTAGRAVGEFVSQITSADAALGRLANRIGQAPGDISALANAVGRAGGSMEAAQGSMERFSDAMQELKRTGTTGILTDLSRIQALGGKPINLFNKDTIQTQYEIADNLKAISDKYGEVTARSYGKQAGFDADTVTLMIRGSAAMRRAAEESRKLGIATEKDTKAAQAFQTSIRGLTQVSEGLGRTIWTNLSPALTDVVNRVLDWYKANGEWLRTEIADKVKQLSDYIKGIDWEGVGKGILAFARGADDAAKAIGGWKVAAELFFGLWAASKIVGLFAPLFAQLALVRLTLLRMGPIGWGLLGLGALAGALASADPSKAIVSGGVPNGGLNPSDELPGLGGLSGGGRGGAGIRTRARRSAATRGGSDTGGPMPAIPDTVPMSAQERNTLGLIMRHESHGQNVMNYVGKSQGLDPNTAKGYTAQGYYQLLNSNWRRLAPKLGITTSNAMSSSLEDQTRVALALMRESGVKNWSNYNPALRAALARGDKADTASVPNVAPSSASATGNPDGSPLPTDGKGVNDDLMRVVKRAQEISAVKFHIHEGLRTLERQKEMVARGWSKTMNSKHLTGRAVDLRADGDPAVGDLDAAKYAKINDAMKKAANELGVPIQWGGDSFGKFKDVPHFQLPDGYKSAAQPSAMRGIPNAGAVASQAAAAQATLASAVSNDNRSSVSNSTRIGDIHVHTAATDAEGITRDMESQIKRRSFATAANYGQA